MPGVALLVAVASVIEPVPVVAAKASLPLYVAVLLSDCLPSLICAPVGVPVQPDVACAIQYAVRAMLGERVRHAGLEARRRDFRGGGCAQGGVGVAGCGCGGDVDAAGGE